MNSRSWSHNPTPQPLGHGHVWCLRERSNLRNRLFRPALVHLSYTGELGGDGENRTLIGWVQASNPPVERRPQWQKHGCGGGNRTHLVAAYETAVCTSSSSPQNLVDRARIEPATFRVSDGRTACRALGRWSPAAESNCLFRFTGAAHHQKCLRGWEIWSRRSESNAHQSNSRFGEPYRATTLPLSYTGWSRRADSNRHLGVTRALFFPLNYFDLERVTGFEPVSGPWQGPILAARRYPHGASGENRTLLACLEGRNSTNKSRSRVDTSTYTALSKNTLRRQRRDG